MIVDNSEYYNIKTIATKGRTIWKLTYPQSKTAVKGLAMH
jgi:hypothetical protein